MQLSPYNYPNTFNELTLFKNELISKVDKSLLPKSDEIKMETEQFTIHLQLSFETNQHPHDEIVYNSIVHGRKAGKMPPMDSIRVWIARKGITPNPINGKLPTVKQLSFLIARSIGLHGTGEFYTGKNKSFFQGNTPKTGYEAVLEQIGRDWSRRIEEAFVKDLENEIASDATNKDIIG